jgi:hypothetical protein
MPVSALKTVLFPTLGLPASAMCHMFAAVWGMMIASLSA